MTTYKQIERLTKLINKEIFTINSTLSYSRLMDAVDLLADLVSDYSEDDDESVWYIGECGHCSLGDLIPALYWHASEWYGGPELHYSTLCKLGEIYSPNMCNGPEPETSEKDAYDFLEVKANEN